MDIITVKDYAELSRQAAEIVVNEINKKPDLVLGLPTGQTPEGMYRELIKKYKEGKLDFSKVTTFNLDEYYGLDSNHPQSYHYFMWDIFFKHISIKKENVHLLNGVTENIKMECQDYEDLIKAKRGIDLQILGIGENGHIGFNEPATKLSSKTHLISLSEETIKVNARYFDSTEQVPRLALTMGIGSIMQAKKIVLLASGKRKAEAIAKTTTGLVSTEVPASLLQLHNKITVLADTEAAKRIA